MSSQHIVSLYITDICLLEVLCFLEVDMNNLQTGADWLGGGWWSPLLKWFNLSIEIQALITVCLVPKPHYYARPMRFGSRSPREFLRPRQTRRSETFCLTWGGAFGSGRAVNNFSALMKDVQKPWRVQRTGNFYSMHVLIIVLWG